MKILIINRYMSVYGGAENVVKELSESFNSSGNHAAVIALNISDEVRKLCGNTRMIVPQKQFGYEFRSTGFFASLGMLGEILAMRKLVKANAKDFDVLNPHNFPAYWATFGLKKPVVWMCNEPPDLWHNPKPSLALKLTRFFGILLDKLFVSAVDKVITADDLNAGRVKERYGRDSAIVPYGIDQDIFLKSEYGRKELGAEYGIPASDFILLQVGVLSPQKNQLDTVKALKALLDSGLKAKLLLAGKDDLPYAAKVKEYISANNLKDRVIFTGQLAKVKIAGLYRSADLCVFPVKEQGGWLAPFEALFCKTPVIVSSSMGAADLIKKLDFGIVSDNLNADVVETAKNYDKYKKKAVIASIWVKSNLNWGRFSKDILNICRETADKYKR